MHTLMTFVSEADRCQYLSDQQWRFEYEIVAAATPSEYGDRLRNGWRRFGHSLFRPVCDSCSRCQSVRVPVAGFAPDRSQRRARKANEGTVLVMTSPSETAEKRQLFDEFHRYQHESKGWSNGASDYHEMFVANPLPTEEWCYRIDGRLVAVGYVDRVPDGLSLIYFFHDPASRDRSLGTFNILMAIDVARAARLPYVYLGYFVDGCRSLEYKARFRPNEALRPDGSWQTFGTR